jgi:hypothetical protein
MRHDKGRSAQRERAKKRAAEIDLDGSDPSSPRKLIASVFMFSRVRIHVLKKVGAGLNPSQLRKAAPYQVMPYD